MPGPFDDRVYLEMILKSVETDEHGNPIIYAEASNENLDQQEQVVLQRALLESKDYFLRNGVISYDHRHLVRDPSDPDWNPEKYIIGEPLSVEKRGRRTFVKARLFRSNPIVQEIVSKLKDGATYIKTSVGGRRPVVARDFDTKLKRPVEKVVSVQWNELAITPKPVNDSLSPVALSSAAFVKSLSMGYTTDSTAATGGAALGVQDLEGASRKKKAIQAVVTAIAVGDVRTPDAGLALLADEGIESKEATDILEEVVNRRKQISEVFKMDENLTKSFESAIEDLEKALKGTAPAPAAVPAPAPAPVPHAEPDADNAGGPSDGDADNEDDEDDEDGEDMPPAPPMKKSEDEDVEYLDVSPILSSMAKSLKDLRSDLAAIKAENAELKKSLTAQDALLKSIGGAQLSSAQVLKSLTDTPQMRKSVVNRQERFGGQAPAAGAGDPGMTPAEILRKSTIALSQGKIGLRDATILEDRINKGMDIPAETLSILKSVQ